MLTYHSLRRRLSVWNNNLYLRLIWLLFLGSGSLWVAWHNYHQKLSETSFWSLKGRSSDSWLWKSLVKLRHLASQFIKCNVGNGRTAWFWCDNWTPLGPLINLFGDQGPRSTRIRLSAKVGDACNDFGWKMAAPRSVQAESLHSICLLCSCPLIL